MKDKHNTTSDITWCIAKSVPGYSNILKKCKKLN